MRFLAGISLLLQQRGGRGSQIPSLAMQASISMLDVLQHCAREAAPLESDDIEAQDFIALCTQAIRPDVLRNS